MKEIIFDREGLKINEQLPPSLSWIKKIEKDDLIKCLLNVETLNHMKYWSGSNKLKSLIHDFDNYEQFVSLKKVGYSPSYKVEISKFHFVNDDYVSNYNIEIYNECVNISDCIRNGKFFISDLITAKMGTIDELMAKVNFPIHPFTDFKEGEPIFDYPINNNLYYIGNNSTFCFPFTKIISKKVAELNLKCYIENFGFEINNIDFYIEFTFDSERNIGGHRYLTTQYNGKIYLHDLSVELTEGEQSYYKY